MLVTLSDYEGFADYSLYRPCPLMTGGGTHQNVSQAVIEMDVIQGILIFMS